MAHDAGAEGGGVGGRGAARGAEGGRLPASIVGGAGYTDGIFATRAHVCLDGGVWTTAGNLTLTLTLTLTPPDHTTPYPHVSPNPNLRKKRHTSSILPNHYPNPNPGHYTLECAVIGAEEQIYQTGRGGQRAAWVYRNAPPNVQVRLIYPQ